MQRRSVLKNLAVTFTGLASLPAWAASWTPNSLGPISTLAVDDLATLPDGEFWPPYEQSCVEKHFTDQMALHYNGTRPIIIGRCAHLTKPQPIHYQQGRGQCQNRSLCQRGCPYGG